MKRNENNWKPEPCEEASSDRFEAMIAYEDLGTGLIAHGILDRIASGLGLMAQANVAPWRLDILKDRACLARAARDALLAEVVLLSLHGGIALTSEVKAWFETWLSEPSECRTALGVLLDWDMRHTSSVDDTLTYLRRTTQRRPVDLFVGFFSTERHVPGDILYRPEPRDRWGINE